MNPATKALGMTIKRLANIGLGQIPGVLTAYRFAWKNFGPKGVVQADVDGLKLLVDCRDWAVAPTMIFAHSWEPAETKIFKQYLKEGMTVIDAGAYIGYYSLLASRMVGSKGKVYAFEPSPENLKLLHKNIKLNGCENIKVFEQAVSDESGHATFYPNPRNLSGSTMFENYSSTRNRSDTQIEISTTTLDNVIGDRKVDFIKMDIEGGETRALSGMTNIINSNHNLKMIIEVFPIGLAKVGSSLDELVNTLQRRFQLYIVGNSQSTSAASLRDIQAEIKKAAVINLFCCRI